MYVRTEYAYIVVGAGLCRIAAGGRFRTDRFVGSWRVPLPLPLPLPLASPFILPLRLPVPCTSIVMAVTGTVDIAIAASVTVAPRYHYRRVSLPLPFSVDNTVACTVALRYCCVPVAGYLCRFFREK